MNSQQTLTINDENFIIWSLDCDNFGLDQNYKIVCHISAKTALDKNKLLKQAATITIQNTKIYGLISHINDRDQTPEQNHNYSITISSPLYPLTTTISNRIFVNKDIVTIIKEILNQHNLSNSNVQFITTKKYRQKELIAQYQETDFAFLQEQLSRHGLFISYDKNKIVISDDIQKLGNNLLKKEINYQNSFSLIKKTKIVTNHYKLRDYNDITPEINLTTTTKQTNSPNSHGEAYIYGPNCATQAELEERAQYFQQANDLQRGITTLTCDIKDLTLGQTVQLNSHPIKRYNGEYRLLNIAFNCDQSSGQIYAAITNKQLYQVTLTLIPAKLPYRQPISSQKLSGIHIAKIVGNKDDYANIDSLGRYQTKLLFATDSNNTSNRLRLAQPYSGEQFGLHFPLRANTKVIFGCINGDINRPIILGAISNSEYPSPVNNNNQMKNALQSRTNSLIMDDQENSEKMTLYTNKKNNQLTLNNSKNCNGASLTTSNGTMNLIAGKNIGFIGNNHHQNSKNNYELFTKETINYKTRKHNIKLTANHDINIKAKNSINSTAKTNIKFICNKNYLAHSKHNINYTAKHGKLTLTAKTGGIFLKAQQNITIKKGTNANIIIEQSGARITIDSNNNIHCKAKQIDIIADTTNLIGENIRYN